MLRISTVNSHTERRLVVEGELVEPWVGELAESWFRARQDLGGRKLIIDLGSVTVMGCKGQEALFNLMRQGARFECGGVLTRYVLRRLAHRCNAQAEDRSVASD